MTTTWHVSVEVLHRYADPGAIPLPPAVAASVEAHLPMCRTCSDALGAQLPAPDLALLGALGAQLHDRAASTPQYRRSRRARLPGGAAASWLGGVLAAFVGAALLAGATGPGPVPLPLLLAPVVPLLGTAVAWAPGLDPLHELASSTPRSGLALLLRRTVLVLVVVVPVLAVAGALTGAAPPARWLLPCLALTTLTLALGGAVGVGRAAALLGALWVAAVVLPSLGDRTLPLALRTPATGWWLAAVLAGAAVVALRREAYRRPAR